MTITLKSDLGFILPRCRKIKPSRIRRRIRRENERNSHIVSREIHEDEQFETINVNGAAEAPNFEAVVRELNRSQDFEGSAEVFSESENAARKMNLDFSSSPSSFSNIQEIADCEVSSPQQPSITFTSTSSTSPSLQNISLLEFQSMVQKYDESTSSESRRRDRQDDMKQVMDLVNTAFRSNLG